MSEVTSPILTDATGQEIVSKLNTLLTKMDNLAAAFQPNASGIVYSNTTSGLTGDDVQEAVDEVAGDVTEIKQSLSNLHFVQISESAVGTAELALPSDWDELVLQVYISSINMSLISGTIIRSMVGTSYMHITLGNYGTSYAIGQIKADAAKIGTVNWGGSTITNDARLIGFYKKY